MLSSQLIFCVVTVLIISGVTLMLLCKLKVRTLYAILIKPDKTLLDLHPQAFDTSLHWDEWCSMLQNVNRYYCKILVTDMDQWPTMLLWQEYFIAGLSPYVAYEHEATQLGWGELFT